MKGGRKTTDLSRGQVYFIIKNIGLAGGLVPGRKGGKKMEELAKSGIGEEMAFFDVGHENIWTSLKLEEKGNKKTMLKALSQADYNFESFPPGGFEVENLLIHEVELESEDGELIKQMRIVLISPSGETCSFCSNGVVKGIKNLMFVYGVPPWNPAVKVRVKQVKTRKGFRTYNIEVVE